MFNLLYRWERLHDVIDIPFDLYFFYTLFRVWDGVCAHFRHICFIITVEAGYKWRLEGMPVKFMDFVKGKWYSYFFVYECWVKHLVVELLHYYLYIILLSSYSVWLTLLSYFLTEAGKDKSRTWIRDNYLLLCSNLLTVYGFSIICCWVVWGCLSRRLLSSLIIFYVLLNI